MEADSLGGAAILINIPAAGYRSGDSVYDVGRYGYYWSSSVFNEFLACYVYFSGCGLYPQSNTYRYDGFSVRLVR